MSNPLDILSTRYEAWITSLKANQGQKRKRIVGAFASVLGDKTIEWGHWANLEHMPTFSSDTSAGLIASERQLDVSPYESIDNIRKREPFAVNISKYYSSGLGILLGLYFAGFPGAVLVQQNGRALSLNLPLPDFVLGTEWDPKPNLVVTQLGTNPQTNHAWWTFDLNDAFCSRFAVLFPDGSFPFMTWGRATFAESDSADVAWNIPMQSTSYRVIQGAPVVTDGSTPFIGYADLTQSGLTAQASGDFSGYVDFWAYPDTSVNPFAWLRDYDLARLAKTIKKWRPGKSTCVGAYVFAEGACWDWPVENWDDPGNWDDANTIVAFEGLDA